MYWTKPGKENTRATVDLALQRAKELGIKHIVVASNSGATVENFLSKEFSKNLNIVCVTHHVGFTAPGKDEMLEDTRRNLQEKGIKVLTSTHLLAGVDRAVRIKFGGLYPAEIIAASLRMLGQGVKVCAEVASMALDAGAVPFGEEIIAVGGTGCGADTACVILPAHSNNFFDTRIKEIICRPR